MADSQLNSSKDNRFVSCGTYLRTGDLARGGSCADNGQGQSLRTLLYPMQHHNASCCRRLLHKNPSQAEPEGIAKP
jgi:hypothetical protein